MPTVPIVAPTIAALDQDEAAYHQTNLLVLRNPTLVNFLDGCALSLPCHRAGEAPVGLMLARFDGGDDLVLAIAGKRQIGVFRATDLQPLARPQGDLAALSGS